MIKGKCFAGVYGFFNVLWTLCDVDFLATTSANKSFIGRVSVNELATDSQFGPVWDGLKCPGDQFTVSLVWLATVSLY